MNLDINPMAVLFLPGLYGVTASLFVALRHRHFDGKASRARAVNRFVILPMLLLIPVAGYFGQALIHNQARRDEDRRLAALKTEERAEKARDERRFKILNGIDTYVAVSDPALEAQMTKMFGRHIKNDRTVRRLKKPYPTYSQIVASVGLPDSVSGPDDDRRCEWMFDPNKAARGLVLVAFFVRETNGGIVSHRLRSIIIPGLTLGGNVGGEWIGRSDEEWRNEVPVPV
jgi:hypothetical protein